MKIFSAAQMKEWDASTITHEPVSSIDLMERAANSCVAWLMEKYPVSMRCLVFCGTGNNGGDGLAIARLLQAAGYACSVYIMGDPEKGSNDFIQNLSRINKALIHVTVVVNEQDFPHIEPGSFVIDALYGSGLNRPLEGVIEKLVSYLQEADDGRLLEVISIDVPSGMFAEKSSGSNAVIKANYTLTLQTLKLCLVMAENAYYFGEVFVIDIGLNNTFYEENRSRYSVVSQGFAARFVGKRKPFSHKGNFGHALLVAGSKGKMGAAVLAARACLRSGIGLLTVNVPAEYASVIHTTVPEAMVTAREATDYSDASSLSKYRILGIGAGMGTDTASAELLRQLLQGHPHQFKVIDADALTILSEHKEWLSLLSAYCVLTPHPKEFDRLFGECADDFERANRALEKSRELDCVIILKGHYTLVAHNEKGMYIRSGNAGMAKGGSGDVLTGILTGLLSAGTPFLMTLAAVHVHGMAANIAVKHQSEYSLLATDIIEHLGNAFDELINTPLDMVNI